MLHDPLYLKRTPGRAIRPGAFLFRGCMSVQAASLLGDSEFRVQESDDVLPHQVVHGQSKRNEDGKHGVREVWELKIQGARDQVSGWPKNQRQGITVDAQRVFVF